MFKIQTSQLPTQSPIISIKIKPLDISHNQDLSQTVHQNHSYPNPRTKPLPTSYTSYLNQIHPCLSLSSQPSQSYQSIQTIQSNQTPPAQMMRSNQPYPQAILPNLSTDPNHAHLIKSTSPPSSHHSIKPTKQ